MNNQSNNNKKKKKLSPSKSFMVWQLWACRHKSYSKEPCRINWEERSLETHLLLYVWTAKYGVRKGCYCPNFYWFYCSAWYRVVRDMSLVSLGQVSLFCPSSWYTSSLFTGRAAQEREKSLVLHEHCSATAKTSMCCQYYSHPKSRPQYHTSY